MQRKWLEHFCKYRHICEFLGNEGKEKEEIKEYLMQELGLPEATARYQMQRALEDEDGIVKTQAWYYDAKSDLAEAQGDGTESCRYFEKMDELLGQAIELKQQLEERGVKVD